MQTNARNAAATPALRAEDKKKKAQYQRDYQYKQKNKLIEETVREARRKVEREKIQAKIKKEPNTGEREEEEDS